MPLIDVARKSWIEPPGHVRGYSKCLISQEDGLSERLDFRLSRYPIGGRADLHTHERAEHVYYFTEGRGLVTCGEEQYVVSPGDAVFIPPRTVHGVENTGDTDLAFIVVTTPPDDIPR